MEIMNMNHNYNISQTSKQLLRLGANI